MQTQSNVVQPNVGHSCKPEEFHQSRAEGHRNNKSGNSRAVNRNKKKYLLQKITGSISRRSREGSKLRSENDALNKEVGHLKHIYQIRSLQLHPDSLSSVISQYGKQTRVLLTFQALLQFVGPERIRPLRKGVSA